MTVPAREATVVGSPPPPGSPPSPRVEGLPATAAREWWGKAARGAGWGLAIVLPAGFLALFFAWPVLTMVARGLTTDGQLDLGGFSEVFAAPRTWRLIGTTLAQAVCGTAISVVLGLPGAYVLYRCRFPGQRVARALVTVPFVLPAVVVGIAFRTLFVEGGLLDFLHLDESFPAVVLALVFFNYTVVVRTVGGLWERLDPRAEQAARALGAGPWRVWWTITVPALSPALASAASVVFLFCATAFGVVLVLGGARYGTIETEIWTRTTQFLDLRTAAVLSIVQTVVVVLALLVANRARSRRERAPQLVSATPHRLRLMTRGPATAVGAIPVFGTAAARRGSRWRWRWRPGPDAPAALITFLVMAGLLLLPIMTLVVRSFRDHDGWTLGHYRNLATTGEHATLSVSVWAAAAASLRTAAIATTLAVLVGGLVAIVVSRRPRRRSARRAVAVLDSVFMLPLGVSAVTVGFGFLITLDRPLGLDIDLRSAGLLVPIAQAIVAVPLVVRTVLPVLRAIDPRQREVAATLGAAPGRVLSTVDLPVVARSLGLAVGFAFAVSLGEFGATAFLARGDTATLPVVIFRLIGRPGAENYGMALAASVVLAGMTTMVMMLAERLRGERAGEW